MTKVFCFTKNKACWANESGKDAKNREPRCTGCGHSHPRKG